MPRDVSREAAKLILKGARLSGNNWLGIVQSRLDLAKQLLEQYPTPTLEKALRSHGEGLLCTWVVRIPRVFPEGIQLNTHVILGGETEAEESRRDPHRENRWGMTRSGKWFTALAVLNEDDEDDPASRPRLTRLAVQERTLEEMLAIYGPPEIAKLLGSFIYSCRNRHTGLFKAVEIVDAQEELLRFM